jgi:4-methyl-5(b-hydroxyethyl)-thiazole monophosphate biosynthesis
MHHWREFMKKKKILLVVYPTFSEFEITVTTAILKAHFDIITASDSISPVIGESSLKILPHIAFEEVKAEDYEGIIIPGGDLYYIKDSDALFRLVGKFCTQDKLVAAICSGGYVLARAGLLINNPYTVTLNKEQRDFLGCFNEDNFTYENIVRSKNIITAQGHAFVEFALDIARHLNVYKEEYKEFYSGVRNRLME